MNENKPPEMPKSFFDPPGGILPGLGIVVGIWIGIVLWQTVVEETISVSASASWWIQGVFFAVCIVAASLIDGFVRPHDWRWPTRLRVTFVIAIVVIGLWGIASLGHSYGGTTGAAWTWGTGALLLSIIEWRMRRRAKDKRAEWLKRSAPHESEA